MKNRKAVKRIVRDFAKAWKEEKKNSLPQMNLRVIKKAIKCFISLQHQADALPNRFQSLSVEQILQMLLAEKAIVEKSDGGSKTVVHDSYEAFIDNAITRLNLEKGACMFLRKLKRCKLKEDVSGTTEDKLVFKNKVIAWLKNEKILVVDTDIELVFSNRTTETSELLDDIIQKYFPDDKILGSSQPRKRHCTTSSETSSKATGSKRLKSQKSSGIKSESPCTAMVIHNPASNGWMEKLLKRRQEEDALIDTINKFECLTPELKQAIMTFHSYAEPQKKILLDWLAEPTKAQDAKDKLAN